MKIHKIIYLLLVLIVFSFALSSCSKSGNVYRRIGKDDVKEIKIGTVENYFDTSNIRRYKELHFDIVLNFDKNTITNTRFSGTKKLTDKEVQTILDIVCESELLNCYENENIKTPYLTVEIKTFSGEKRKIVSHEWSFYEKVFNVFLSISKAIGFDIFNFEDIITSLTLKPIIHYRTLENPVIDNKLPLYYNEPQNPIRYNYGNYINNDQNMIEYINRKQRLFLPKTSNIYSSYAEIILNNKYVGFRDIIVKQYSLDGTFERLVEIEINHSSLLSGMIPYNLYSYDVLFNVETNKYYHIYLEDMSDSIFEYMISTVLK